MANEKRVRDAIRKFLTSMQATDSIPEELAEDALEMTEEVNNALCEAEDEEANPLEVTKDECKSEDIDKKVADGVVKALRELGFYKDPAMKALDELEEKLDSEDEEPDDITEDADNEESVTVDPEKMKDSATLLRAMKPIIAQIKDSKERKKAADALARMVGYNRKTTSDYGIIMNAKQKKAAKDSKTTDADYNFGMDIAKRFNPHYKEEK